MRIQNHEFPLLPLALLPLLLNVAAENMHGEASSPAMVTQTLTEAEIQTMLQDNIGREPVGLVVGIADEHGRRVISYGKLDNGTDREVDGDTLFEIGSITKVFTALLLQDMVDRGEMKLDDPVQRYLPASVKMPTYQGRQITLLHLATHTSGLPRDVNNETPRSWRNPGEGYTVAQFYDFLSHCKLGRAPGTRQEYSNLGVALLGYVISLKAGKDYETLLEERICRPLGMDGTHITVPSEMRPRLAGGHCLPDRRVMGEDFSFLPGAGGIHSTANDLLKFISAYAGLTPSPLRALMQEAEAYHALEDGTQRRLAWWGNETVFMHGGLTYGFSADLAFDCKKRRGVVVLSNCSNSRFLPAVTENERLLGGRSPLPERLAPADTAFDDQCSGQYQIDKNSNIYTIRREGKRWLAQWLGRSGERYAVYELYPQSASVFRNDFFDTRVTFLPATNSQALKLFFVYPQGCFEMTKISGEIPKPPAPIQANARLYDGFAGRYRKAFLFGLIHLGPILSVRRETDEMGDHLVASIRGSHLETVAPTLSGGYLGCELFPASETSFFNPQAGNLRVSFVRNKKGKTTGLIAELNGVKIAGDRVSNQPAK
ncbi:MAG: serine hydrolase domain-containing protein [Limisphaerales bacterium]